MKTHTALILASLCASHLSAQENPMISDSTACEISLNEVVVSATRTQKLLKDVPVQTRLISHADIAKADANTIQDLLQTELPGVEFSYAMNQQVNMNFGGFAGQSILILVDGERLAGETMDNVDFSRLLMQNVARIEIVKGAASALYGSNAAGGVINIISNKNTRPWIANINAKGGAHGEWRVGCVVSANGKHVGNTLDVSFYRIRTYSVCSNLADECDFRTVYGYKTWNINDKFTYSPNEQISLTARAGYYFKERYYNPDTPDRYRDFSGGLRGEFQIGDNNHLEAAYSFDQYDKSDYLLAQKYDIRDYRNVINALRILDTHTFTHDVILTLGGDVSHDYLDTYQFASGNAKRQLCLDAFAQADWTINNHWELVGALRYDYFSDSKDSRLTSKINARYKASALTLRGGYAQGFRAPTLKERYMDFDMASIFDIHGNPYLRPETSNNFNLSAEYSWKGYNFMLGGNYSIVDNKISTSAVRYAEDGNPYIDYINVERLNVASIDASINARWAYGLSAKFSYAFVYEQTKGGALTQYCPARPHSISAQLSWIKEWTSKYSTDVTLFGRFLSQVSYNSMYMYEPFEMKHVVNPAYSLWKMQLQQTIANGLRLNIVVDNIFNYRPQIYSFNSPVTTGTTLQIGVNIDIDRFL